MIFVLYLFVMIFVLYLLVMIFVFYFPNRASLLGHSPPNHALPGSPGRKQSHLHIQCDTARSSKPNSRTALLTTPNPPPRRPSCRVLATRRGSYCCGAGRRLRARPLGGAAGSAPPNTRNLDRHPRITLRVRVPYRTVNRQ